MSLLIENARLIDPEAGTDQIGAVVIAGGQIADVLADGATARADRVLDAGGKALAPGIVDLGVKVCEPGERHKESFRTAGRAAAAGGVTTMITRPDTTPVIDSPEQLEFVTRRAAQVAPVNVYPMAALTKGFQGREMVEIGFLRDAGAVAFTDADRPINALRSLDIPSQNFHHLTPACMNDCTNCR